MPNNKNEILSERKKAQRSFIELKKMQAGEITPEKAPEAVLTTKTKWQTFWFYHKVHIIIAFLVAIIMAFCITQCALKPKYDAKVIVYTNTFLSDIQIGYFKDYLTPYFEDINNDGEVNIQFIDCSYNTDDSYDLEYVRSMATRLQAIISSEGDALLFITDQKRFDELDTNFNSVEHFFTDSINLPNIAQEKAKADGIEIPENLILGKRVIGGTMIESSRDIELHTKQADGVIDKLKTK